MNHKDKDKDIDQDKECSTPEGINEGITRNNPQVKALIACAQRPKALTNESPVDVFQVNGGGIKCSTPEGINEGITDFVPVDRLGYQRVLNARRH